MRRIGDQHFDPVGLAAIDVIGADDHDPGQFALRTGSGLQGSSRETANFGQPVLEFVDKRKIALDGFNGLEGMSQRENRADGRLFR